MCEWKLPTAYSYPWQMFPKPLPLTKRAKLGFERENGYFITEKFKRAEKKNREAPGTILQKSITHSSEKF